MPTQFKTQPRGEWAHTTEKPRRSVFGNYSATREPAEARPETGSGPPCRQSGAASHEAVDLAVARSFIFRLLAKAYENPNEESWNWLCDAATQQNLTAAGHVCEITPLPSNVFRPDGLQSFLDAYFAAFGHAARGGCPLNEIEYGDIKADPLFQPHRLADLAAFYRAFGLEVSDDAGERHDHICLEFEFMCVLAAKEAYALEHELETERVMQCRDAQKKFLREHIGRWTPAFTRRLTAASSNPVLQALASFTRAFTESECARFGVQPGSEDLALRPVDESADRMCDSCGINNLPPGALATT